MAEITPGPGWWKAADDEWYPPRWEYRWVQGRLFKPDSKSDPAKRDRDIERMLASLGSQGWEAVSTMGDAVTMDNTAITVLVKRPLRP